MDTDDQSILEGYYNLHPLLSQILETDLNVTEKVYKNSSNNEIPVQWHKGPF